MNTIRNRRMGTSGGKSSANTPLNNGDTQLNSITDNEEEEKLVEMNSSLPLQIAIYLNAFYSIAWLLCTFVLSIAKVTMFKGQIERRRMIAFIIVYICSAALEGPRLWVGWKGNLSEKVTKMFAFLILTFLQLGTQLLMAIWQPVHLPLNTLLGVFSCVFLGVELVIGAITVRKFVRISGLRFALYFNKDGTLYKAPEEPEEIREFVEDFSDNSDQEDGNRRGEDIELDDQQEDNLLADS